VKVRDETIKSRGPSKSTPLFATMEDFVWSEGEKGQYEENDPSKKQNQASFKRNEVGGGELPPGAIRAEKSGSKTILKRAENEKRLRRPARDEIKNV